MKVMVNEVISAAYWRWSRNCQVTSLCAFGALLRVFSMTAEKSLCPFGSAGRAAHFRSARIWSAWVNS